MTNSRQTIQSLLEFVYGADLAATVYPQLAQSINHFKHRYRPRAEHAEFLSERDVVLITYGDSIERDNEAPLATLDTFLTTHVQGIVNTIHILPFFPYSSDDGFSVIDYRQINPGLGRWQHIERLGSRFKLMFDLVLNHISVHSAWFKAFQRSGETHRDYFVTADPQTDLSLVTRPRTHPLLTTFETTQGVRHVWTTFSSDQVDLNFANPSVLLEIVEVLLFYIEHGADVIRLDAVAFLWKEIGTTCLHHPKTHAVVQLLRGIVDEVAPHVLLITETNVPHQENLSYFGDGTNEAHLVYQFALPPLIAHTLLSGSAHKLSDWAAALRLPSEHAAFFNFTASHDGIGVRPVTGILSEAELDALIQQTLRHGGRVSYKSNPDGTQSPYELNIVYYSLLNAVDSGEQQALQVQRFLCSQAIMLSLAGLPAIYIHSLIGSQNDDEGLERAGYNRAINRKKLNFDALKGELADPASVRHQVFHGYRRLLKGRTCERAFHPDAEQAVLVLSDQVFAVLRMRDKESAIIALHNITATPQGLTLPLRDLGFDGVHQLIDILTNQAFDTSDDIVSVMLQPYQIAWLRVYSA